MKLKCSLGKNVLSAAVDRIEYCLDRYDCYLAFSGGKDSTVMFHIAASVAKRKGVKFGVLVVDLEAQYKATIDHMLEMVDIYSDVIDLYWYCVPLNLRNATSNINPFWKCWDAESKNIWCRDRPEFSITSAAFHNDGMEFEEFVEKFGKNYSTRSCCLLGIRTDESFNRYRAIKESYKSSNGFTTSGASGVVNAYPIYDWAFSDIWLYHLDTGFRYNEIYELMYKAGLKQKDMRICQPYGDDQKKGLYLYQVLEPETWKKVVQRVSGANGYVNGASSSRVSKPSNISWSEYSKFILSLMPINSRSKYSDNISRYVEKWTSQGYSNGIPEESPRKLESKNLAPSWRKICSSLLKNDYWGIGMGMSNSSSKGYSEYLKYLHGK